MRTTWNVLDLAAKILLKANKFMSEGPTNHNIPFVSNASIISSRIQPVIRIAAPLFPFRRDWTNTVLVLVRCDETVYQFRFLTGRPIYIKIRRPVFINLDTYKITKSLLRPYLLLFIFWEHHFRIPNHLHVFRHYTKDKKEKKN